MVGLRIAARARPRVLPPGTLDGTEGLLGMNILKRFHFRIDQAGNALLLDPIH